jgi:hypothetical protein
MTIEKALEIQAQQKARRLLRFAEKTIPSPNAQPWNSENRVSAAAMAGKKRTALRQTEAEHKHRLWQMKVRERDNWTCRFPGCGYRSKTIDAHHINERSQRPDLRYDPDNGACLCGHGTPNNHHDYIHHTPEGREKGKQLGLLGGQTYEAALKQEKGVDMATDKKTTADTERQAREEREARKKKINKANKLADVKSAVVLSPGRTNKGATKPWEK